jgi:inner membrane protein
MMFRTHRMFIIMLCMLIYMNPYNIFSALHLNNNIFTINFLVFMLIAIFGSMMPDIDNPSSKLGKNIKIVGYVFKHRGFFHSLPSLILFTFISYRFLNVIWTFAFFLGYFSHLILDNMTYQGIYWLYPLKYRIKGFTKSKSLFEKAFFYVNVVTTLLLAVYFL